MYQIVEGSMYTVQRKGRAQIISLCAMFIALTVLFLYLSTILPTAKISMFFVSSVFVGGILIEGKPGSAFLVFIASALVSLLIIPNKLYLIPYVALFGHYGIGKYYLEKIKDKVLAYFAKLLYFNIGAALIYVLIAYVFMMPQIFTIPLWVLIIAAEVAFVIYDFVYSKITVFYAVTIRPALIKR